MLKRFIMETYSFVTPAMFINVIYFARAILSEICLPIGGFFNICGVSSACQYNHCYFYLILLFQRCINTTGKIFILNTI